MPFLIMTHLSLCPYNLIVLYSDERSEGEYKNTLYCRILLSLFVCLMVFNAIFNNISVISWRSVLLVEETRGP